MHIMLRYSLLGLLILVLYAVSVIAYRLTLHPLAKHSGPLLARITGWHDSLHISRGNRHLELLRQHEIYGPIVRFSPNLISINTPAALHEIYSSRKANVVKSDWYVFTHAATGGRSNTHSTVNRERHAAKRRLLSHAFSDHALKSAEGYIVKNVQKWCHALGESQNSQEKNQWSNKRNMATWASYLGFDILGDLCFGESFHTIESEENRYVLHLIGQLTKTVYILGYVPYSALMRRVMATPWLSGLFGGQIVRDQQKFINFATSSLARRQAKEAEYEKAKEEDVRKDFFHYLLRGRDPETGGAYSDSELAAESVLLISAGADTVAIAIAASIFYLSHNPLVLQRLVGEIRSAFTSVEDIRHSSPALSSLPYLRACLDEAMRMTPPALSHLPRKVLPGGATIDGVYYPAGTNVGVSAYAIHHNEDPFPDPFSFRPERWVAGPDTGVSEESVMAAHAAFCPFSLGTRGCIGKGLAYMEMTTALARLLWLYDVRGVEGDRTGEGALGAGWGKQRPGEYQVRDFFVAERDGPMVQFRAREGEVGREVAV